MHDHDEGEFLYHEPCPKCGSSDGLARYSDGHGFCFPCRSYFKADGEAAPSSNLRRSSTVSGKELIPISDQEVKPNPKRKLSVETCQKWQYTVSNHKGRPVQVANYRTPDGSEIVAQKIRYADKTFTVLGDLKQAAPLYGMWLWQGNGKKVVITEGEVDCLTVSQVQGNKWPVVSVPNGAAGAKKAIVKALDWLSSFEEVVLMFDNDEPGRAASEECAAVLPPGKAKIARLPLKDPSDMLQADRAEELVNAIWKADPFRPAGVVSLADIRTDALATPEMGLPWWMEDLTQATYGRRYGEIYCFGAGTGIGKTDWLTQQIEFDISTLGKKVGVFFLEQEPGETAKRICGKAAGKRFWVPDGSWSQEELVVAFDRLSETRNLYLYDHFGSTDWDEIKSTIRYLVHADGVRLFYIDHLTALAAAEDDEKKALEQIMADMGGLVKELDITIHLVSHLATPEGKSHEEGGRVMIRHFKGSRAIGFWCHFMFGLEREQQAEDETERQVTTFRVLKDRYTGQATGKTFELGYDQESGRLYRYDRAAEDFDPHADGKTDGAECPF